jgi:hypothetical protein
MVGVKLKQSDVQVREQACTFDFLLLAIVCLSVGEDKSE